MDGVRPFISSYSRFSTAPEEQEERARLPRTFGADDTLQQFNSDRSFGQRLLWRLNGVKTVLAADR